MTIPKFRAWDKKSKVLSLVGRIDFFKRQVSILSPSYHSVGFENIKLMQSTGMLDKNGKEIYEGDILRTYDGELAKVVWNVSLGCWEAEFLDEIVDLSEVADIQSNRSDCEIVGNIYENRELLEEE